MLGLIHEKEGLVMDDNNRGHPWWDDRVELTKTTDVSFDNSIFATPKSIYNYFDSRIYGCEEYKKKMSVAIWSSLHRNTKSNILVIGESGCGKTELARVLKKVYPNTTIFDASNASPKAFKGNNSLSDCLLSVDTSQKPWVFIDEFDKCILKGSNVGSMMADEILKLAEGAQIYVGEDKQRKLVDTSLVNCVFIGSFSELKKHRSANIGFCVSVNSVSKDSPITKTDILDSLNNEFLGRMNGGIIQLPSMTPNAAKEILKDERYSPVTRLEKQYGISISIHPNHIEELANMTTEYGVRGIYSALQERICNALFENSETTTIEL